MCCYSSDTKKSGLLVLLFAVMILGAMGLGKRFLFPAAQQKENTVQMTVFVHGSFASLLGFLSYAEVISDKLSGSVYRQITKKMRADDFFFRDQIILQRGLIPVEPTFDLQKTGGKKYAAYPLIMAYKEINDAFNPNHEQTLFYTFGWSGLISQNSRRFEAIRFYNLLCEERNRLKAQGLDPHIRIICHSHGGNLALNLAAINKAISLSAWDATGNYSPYEDENESIKAMAKLLQQVTTKETAKTKSDQKIFDYVPPVNDLVIDELVLMGTPLQPETEYFFYAADTFKKIYHIYSDEDFVQRADWVSSKRPLSGQRLTTLDVHKKMPIEKRNIIIQARLLAETPIAEQNKTTPESTDKNEKTVLDALFAGQNIFSRSSKNPTHKELWFALWGDDDPVFSTFLHPMPVVVLCPLIIDTLNKTEQKNTDLDVTITATAKTITVSTAPYKETKTLFTSSMDQEVLEKTKKLALAWKPESLSQGDEFNAVYKHLFE